jgi:hypothetical protein
VRIIWSEIAQAIFVGFMADQAGMTAVNRMDEPVPGHLRAARRSGLTSPDRSHTPSGHPPATCPQDQDLDKPQNE